MLLTGPGNLFYCLDRYWSTNKIQVSLFNLSPRLHTRVSSHDTLVSPTVTYLHTFFWARRDQIWMSSSPWKGYVLSYTLFSLGELQFIGLALCDPAQASMYACACRYVRSRRSQRSTWGVFLSYSSHSLFALASFSLFSDTPKCPCFQRDLTLSQQNAFGSISNPSPPSSNLWTSPVDMAYTLFLVLAILQALAPAPYILWEPLSWRPSVTSDTRVYKYFLRSNFPWPCSTI